MDVSLAFVVFGTLGAIWMKRKGRSPMIGFFLGGILNIIGMVVIFFIKDKTSSAVESNTKAPFIQKPTYSGSRFAQDSGKGLLFHYTSNAKGSELPLEFADGELKSAGTAVAKLLPALDMFSLSYEHRLQKSLVIEKLRAFFVRFSNL